MEVSPFIKKEVCNSNSPFEWQYGDEKSNIVLKNEFLNVQILRYNILNTDGDVLYDTISIREPETNSVTIITNKQKQIGLVREWRPIPARWFWACVRGFGDSEDEDNLVTAKREMIEEIGNCIILESKKIGSLYQNTTFYENPVGLILIIVDRTNVEKHFEQGISDFQFFDENEILKMIREGKIDDQFTLSAIVKYLAIQESLFVKSK